jgi:hypothetical protein
MLIAEILYFPFPTFKRISRALMPSLWKGNSKFVDGKNNKWTGKSFAR